MTALPAARSGTIVTFYSYKGGTGRSMALADVAWVLASNGKRVLMVDWDLESPGLHRFFHPGLLDVWLRESPGLIDMVWGFAYAAMTPPTKDERTENWHVPYADILRYAVAIEEAFPEGGCLHLVPAGRQDADYATRVSSFDWRNFYDRLSGGAFLEAVKANMRAHYDYVLLDSRTGLSDTSGICTVQMPDVLVCCFTLSNQSIEGAAAVARSVLQQRPDSGFRILPVPMRVDRADQDRLEAGRDYARKMLDGVFPGALEQYWLDVEVPYVPRYAYEEVLATVADRRHDEHTVLSALERLTSYLTEGAVKTLGPMSEAERARLLALLRRGPARGDQPDFYISYSRRDAGWATWIAWTLAEDGYAVFLDAWELRPGDEWHARLALELDRAERVIAVLSDSYLASESRMAEARTAANDRARTGGRLIPVLVDDIELPAPLSDLVHIDLHDRDEAACCELLLSGVVAGWLRPTPSATRARSRAGAERPPFPGGGRPSPAAVPDRLPQRVRPFVGRQALLDEIRVGFEERRSGGREVVQVLAGLPGVGKTAVAIEFAHQARRERPDVVWIAPGQSGAGSLDEVFRELARSPTPRPLVVVDEVDDAGTLIALRLRDRPVDVLVTSRVAVWDGVGRVHRVEALPVDEAAALLQSAGGEEDPHAAKALATALGGVPRALVVAASHVRSTGQSMDAYRELLTTDGGALLERQLPELANALRRAIADVAGESAQAAWLLRSLAFLGPSPVPLHVLARAGVIEERLALDDAVQLLHRRGLATRERDDVRPHPLGQLVVRQSLDEPHLINGLHFTLRLLNAQVAADPEDPAAWPSYQAVAAHARAASAHAERLDRRARETTETGVGRTWAELLARVGRYQLLHDDLAAAAEVLDRALVLAREERAQWRPRDDLPPLQVEIVTDLVEVRRLLGKLDAARDLVEPLIAGATLLPADLGLCRLAVGTVLGDMGDLRGACAHLEAAADQLMPYGRRAGSAGRAKRELGTLLRTMGRLAEARAWLEDALLQHEEGPRARRIDLAVDSRELGATLRDSGELDGARSLLERALLAHASLFGREHHEVGRDLCELGALLREQGDAAAATSCLEEAEQVLEAVLGARHLHVARVRRELGAARRAAGDLFGARKILAQVLTDVLPFLGDDHPEAAHTLAEEARVLRDGGDLTAARAAFERALRMWNRALGPGNPWSERILEELEQLPDVAGPEARRRG